MSDAFALFGYVVDVFVYNKLLRKMTWEPMIFAEFWAQLDGGDTIRVKFIPARYSPAFPSDVVFHWTEKQLQRRVRKHVQEEERVG